MHLKITHVPLYVDVIMYAYVYVYLVCQNLVSILFLPSPNALRTWTETMPAVSLEEVPLESIDEHG